MLLCTGTPLMVTRTLLISEVPITEGSKNTLGELLKERVECLAAVCSAFPPATIFGLGKVE